MATHCDLLCLVFVYTISFSVVLTGTGFGILLWKDYTENVIHFRHLREDLHLIRQERLCRSEEEIRALRVDELCHESLHFLARAPEEHALYAMLEKRHVCGDPDGCLGWVARIWAVSASPLLLLLLSLILMCVAVVTCLCICGRPSHRRLFPRSSSRTAEGEEQSQQQLLNRQGEVSPNGTATLMPTSQPPQDVRAALLAHLTHRDHHHHGATPTVFETQEGDDDEGT